LIGIIDYKKCSKISNTNDEVINKLCFVDDNLNNCHLMISTNKSTYSVPKINDINEIEVQYKGKLASKSNKNVDIEEFLTVAPIEEDK
jgi:hypothetical protein